MSYIRPALKGFPIRYKTIKGKKYAYQRTEAFRDKETGQVHVTDRYLGPVTAARPKPIMDRIDQTDADIITAAWRRGEDIKWIQAYLKAQAGIETTPNTIYKYLRAKGITRGARQQTTKRATTMEQRLERSRRLRREEVEIRAKQARRRLAARKEIEGR